MRALVLLLGAVLYAQAPSFKAGVDLVRIPITVTRDGRAVEQGLLTAADFMVSEDGVSQEVTFFERESLPLSICIVFDASASMGMPEFRQPSAAAVNALVSRLLPADEITIIAFNEQPAVVLPWSFVRDITKLALTLDTRGSTSLHDAVARGLQAINGARNPRPVMLLITDGGENSSRMSLASLVTTRRQSETQIYAFHIVSRIDEPRPSPVGAIVGDSGGVEYRVRSEMDDIAHRAEGLVNDLRSQYTIGYSPLKAPDGTYRRVKVDVKRRGLSIRYRGGYLAALPGTP